MAIKGCIYNGVGIALNHARAAEFEGVIDMFEPAQLRGALNAAQIKAKLLEGGGEALKSATVVSGGSLGINYQGQNIVPQDLQRVARNWLWKQSMMRLLAMLPMVPATQRLHEWVRVRSLGNLRSSFQMAEGGRPTGTSTRSDRANVWITTQGRLNRVTGMARAQQTIEILGSRDPFISNRNALMLLFNLQRITHALWERNDWTNDPDVAWKGIFQQMEEYWADSVAYANNPHNMPLEDVGPYVDVRGHMNRSHVENGTQHFVNQHGAPTHLFLSYNTAQGFQGQLEGGVLTGNANPERIQMVDNGNGVIIGVPIKGIATLSGTVEFTIDKSFDPQYYHALYGPGGFVASEGAPAKPPTPDVDVPVGNVARSRWAAGDIPGGNTIQYIIQAVNAKGESLPSDATASGAVVLAPNQRVNLEWVPSPDADHYRICRNNPMIYVSSGRGLANFWEIGRVKNTGAATLTFTDYNDNIPGYTEALMVEFAHPATSKGQVYPEDAADNAIALADLAGGMKSVMLPALGDYMEEMVFFRQHPVCYMPTRVVRFKNIKPYGA